jgi:hypothetical protein
MPRITLPEAYRVELVERERGWGADVFETIYFDNEKEAREYCANYNSKNTAKVAPDYYTVAEYHGRVQ